MSSFFFFKILRIFIFRERGREGEREVKKHQSVASRPLPDWGTKPTTQACALTRNPIVDLLLCRMTPNRLSHTGQGRGLHVFIMTYFFKRPGQVSCSVFYLLDSFG